MRRSTIGGLAAVKPTVAFLICAVVAGAPQAAMAAQVPACAPRDIEAIRHAERYLALNPHVTPSEYAIEDYDVTVLTLQDAIEVYYGPRSPGGNVMVVGGDITLILDCLTLEVREIFLGQ